MEPDELGANEKIVSDRERKKPISLEYDADSELITNKDNSSNLFQIKKASQKHFTLTGFLYL